MQRRVDDQGFIAEREPPHNIECEQALLGALLVHNMSLGNIDGALKPNHFFEPLHGRLFELISKLIGEGKTVTPTLLKHHVENDPPVGEITVFQYLGRLAVSAATISGVKHYAETIRELADRREMIVIGETVVENAYDGEKATLDAASSAVDSMTRIVMGTGSARTGELVYETAERVMERLLDPSPPDDITPTGLTDLDVMLGGGLIDGDLITIGGRASMGKTTLCHGIAMNITRKDPTAGVCYFSLEMKQEIMTMRALSSLLYNRESPIPYRDMIAKKVPSYHMHRFDSAIQILKGMHLYVDDQPALTMAQISARSRVLQARWARKGIRLRAIVADHMLLMKSAGGRGDQRRHEIEEDYKIAKALAKELMVPFIAAHQVKRGNECGTPDMSDLAESGAIEWHSDVILFPFREAYALRKPLDDPDRDLQRIESLDRVRNDMDVFVAKAKNSETGSVKLFCSIGNNRIGNRAK